MGHLTRRRFIGISAAAGGLAVLPFASPARAEGAVATWRGRALGAVGSITLHHPDRAAAESLVRLAKHEIHRLEAIFSLYRDDSAVTELNRRGVLVAPPPELTAVLDECRHYASITGGAFDPTVQPLWRLYAHHFASKAADPAGPPAGEIRAALELVGMDKVSWNAARIAYRRRGMALTFNGIAQGYITDRVVQLLRAQGIDRSFVDLGEARAIGRRPDGGAWQAGLIDPDDPSRIRRSVPLVDQAIATSGGYGFRFEATGRFHHLLDPRSGVPPHLYKSVSVVAPTATAADALSTAFSAMPLDAIDAAFRRSPGTRVHILPASGEPIVLTS